MTGEGTPMHYDQRCLDFVTRPPEEAASSFVIVRYTSGVKWPEKQARTERTSRPHLGFPAVSLHGTIAGTDSARRDVLANKWYETAFRSGFGTV